MATIGTFTKTSNGFTGTLRTLALNVKAKIVPDQAKASEAAPDYRVFSGTVELGAGWKRTAKGGEQRDYVSVKLDEAASPRAVRPSPTRPARGASACAAWCSCVDDELPC